MIKAFDKSNLNNLRADFDAAIADVAKKYGIAIRLGGIRYDSVKASSKIEFVVTTAPDGSTVTNSRDAADAADFKRAAQSFGLKPEQYGTIFKVGRESYKLVGLNSRAPKMPILGANVRDGRRYKFPEAAIASLQSAEYKEIYGGFQLPAPFVAGVTGQTCSNEAAYDAKFNPIGKCTRPATTSRKNGFGRMARVQPFCNECAQLMDEARRENEAEARMARAERANDLGYGR